MSSLNRPSSDDLSTRVDRLERRREPRQAIFNAEGTTPPAKVWAVGLRSTVQFFNNHVFSAMVPDRQEPGSLTYAAPHNTGLSNATGRFYAPAAGQYICSAGVQIASHEAAADCLVCLFVNEWEWMRGTGALRSSLLSPGLTCSAAVPCAAGAYLTFRVWAGADVSSYPGNGSTHWVSFQQL